jgi:aspartate-semialdehyde dehydrogenase
MSWESGGYNVVVVGAGAVGQLMLQVLEERKFPTKSVKVLARSARTMAVAGKSYEVVATTPDAFDGADIALFAGTEGEKGAAVTFGPAAVERGAIVIDNGSDFRMKPDVPLVVPEVNGHTLDGHKGIIANPNCSTAQFVMALKPIHDAVRIKRVMLSTYQSVSGAGSGGINELVAQNKSVADGGKAEPVKEFSVPIHANVIPQIGSVDENAYTNEEMKLVHETHKIMGDESIKITPILVARVPVLVGHSEAVYIETEKPITPDQARKLWSEFPGVEVIDNPNAEDKSKAWPTPVQAAGSDLTFIGRVRQDLDNPNGLVFWVVSDNLRKGAASNAVQIAEMLVERGLIGAARH